MKVDLKNLSTPHGELETKLRRFLGDKKKTFNSTR